MRTLLQSGLIVKLDLTYNPQMVCVLMGDSIANFMHPAMPQCHVQAEGGISSPDYAARFVHPISADLTIISLGANDHYGGTLEALREVRSRITSRVIWLVPNIRRPPTIDAIYTVASEYGDALVDMAPYCGPRLHPTLPQARQIATAISRSVRQEDTPAFKDMMSPGGMPL